MSRKMDTDVPAPGLFDMLDRLHAKDQELIAKDQELIAKDQELLAKEKELINLKYENERLKIQMEYSTKKKEKLMGDPFLDENNTAPSKKRKSNSESDSNEFKDCSLNMSQIKIEEMVMSTPAHDVYEDIYDYAALEQSLNVSVGQMTGAENDGNAVDARVQFENLVEDSVENYEYRRIAGDEHNENRLDAEEEHENMLNTTVCEVVTPKKRKPCAESMIIRKDFLKKEVTDASIPPNDFEELHTVHADGKHYEKMGHYSCRLCNHELTNASSIVAHIESKHGEAGKKLMCTFPLCRYSERKTKLINHIRAKHTREELYYCDECGKWFYTYRAFKEHEEKHRYMIQCSKCKRFKSSEQCVFCRI